MDGSSDTWIKNTLRLDLINDFWNLETFSLFGKSIFEARLVPLNKAFPNIPKRKEFRPIIVLSSILKYLESRFLPILN